MQNARFVLVQRWEYVTLVHAFRVQCAASTTADPVLYVCAPRCGVLLRIIIHRCRTMIVTDAHLREADADGAESVSSNPYFLRAHRLAVVYRQFTHSRFWWYVLPLHTAAIETNVRADASRTTDGYNQAHQCMYLPHPIFSSTHAHTTYTTTTATISSPIAYVRVCALRKRTVCELVVSLARLVDGGRQHACLCLQSSCSRTGVAVVLLPQAARASASSSVRRDRVCAA
jgi:hypothetical protein